MAQTGKTSDINGQKFLNFGAHFDHYPCDYLTAAAAIGMTTDDVDLFISRLDKVLSKHSKTVESKVKNTSPICDGPEDINQIVSSLETTNLQEF